MAPGVRDETAFMGKLTAGATHELKNVLAIVGESAGLLEDLLHLPACREFSHRDRFLKALASIRDQVRRGTHILTQLNKFAHGADHESAAVRLGELLENLKALSERFLRQKAITLKVVPEAGAEASLHTFPVALQRLFFDVLMAYMEVLPQGCVICGHVGTEGSEAYCRFLVEDQALGEEAVAQVKRVMEDKGLSALVRRLAVTVQVAAGGGGSAVADRAGGAAVMYHIVSFGFMP